LGGWLTTDPIGLAGGYLNLRSYLGNRPADGLDSWGLYWDDSMPMPESQDPYSRGFSDAYRQRMSADSPVDDWRYKAGQAAGILKATVDSPDVREQAKKNLEGLGRGVKRAITDIPDEVADIANGIASAASKAVDPDTYIEIADTIAMLYRCRQNPCCWKKLMERIGEMPSATLEAAARKLKDLGNLKQEEVFEMLGKEWGRAAMAVGAAKIAEGASAAESSMRDPKSLVSRQGPSEMTRNKIEKLAKDMKKNGFNPAHPVEVANVNGEQVIIDGHHRAAAAIRAGIKEIPVTTTPVSPQRAAELAADAAAAAAERSLR
jgi:hypothetical protein